MSEYTVTVEDKKPIAIMAEDPREAAENAVRRLWSRDDKTDVYEVIVESPGAPPRTYHVEAYMELTVDAFDMTEDEP